MSENFLGPGKRQSYFPFVIFHIFISHFPFELGFLRGIPVEGRRSRGSGRSQAVHMWFAWQRAAINEK